MSAQREYASRVPLGHACFAVDRQLTIAPPNGLLGQLQRGLGRGYRAAAKAGIGKDELLRCVLDDPRVDRQLEERDAYYGGLAVLLGLDVEPLAAALRTGDLATGRGALAADTLREMAVRGRNDARNALRDALDGRGWPLALCALEEADALYGHRLLAVADLHRVAAHPDSEIRDTVSWEGALPWSRWAKHVPKLARLVATLDVDVPSAPRTPVRKPDTAMSTAELLRMVEPPNDVRIARILAQRRDARSLSALEVAARHGSHDARLAALRALGAQGYRGLLPYVVEQLESKAGDGPPFRSLPPLLRYLDSLPGDATLPLARRWLASGGPRSIAAERVLASHARAEDRALAEDALAGALDDERHFRACDMAQALGRIGDPRSTAGLVAAYERSAYSWIRPRVLDALAACRSDALAALATEALWDCDGSAREVGARLAPMTRDVRSRLEEMGEDALEEERVRTVADARSA
ncbi:MAG: hypothetical protein AAGH15_06035 [Myxococcota bacterium]